MKDNWLREVDFFTGGGPSEASSGPSEGEKSDAATVQVSSLLNRFASAKLWCLLGLRLTCFVGHAAPLAHRLGSYSGCSGICAGANRQLAAGQAAETSIYLPGAPAPCAGKRQNLCQPFGCLTCSLHLPWSNGEH